MLAITLKDGERFQVSQGGVTAWVLVKIEQGKVRVFIDAPMEFKVLREKLVIPTGDPATAAA